MNCNLPSKYFAEKSERGAFEEPELLLVLAENLFLEDQNKAVLLHPILTMAEKVNKLE